MNIIAPELIILICCILCCVRFSYVQSNQIASAILHLKNVASVMPSEQLLIYDLGLNEADLLTLAGYCNHSKCAIISYDFSQYPSYIMNIDDKTHLFRAIIIKDALNRCKTILFTENYIRLRGSSQAFNEIRKRTENKNGVISLAVKKLPVSSSTHPKLFEYYNSNADSFLFVRLVSLDICFFHYSKFLDDKIMLPWLKCVLTQNCIAPIGASGSISNHCKFNKKPSYRYSGCHSFEASAFNVVLGLAFNFNEAKYSISDDNLLFYKQTLEESNKILDNKRRNISDTTSDHPYSSDE